MKDPSETKKLIGIIHEFDVIFIPFSAGFYMSLKFYFI